MPTIDFSAVKGIDPVPAGEYPSVIVEAVEGLSNNNNPKIDLQFKLETGKKDTDGRIVFDTLTFTEKALFRVKKMLKGLGFAKDFEGNVTAEMLLNRRAIIVVDIETSKQVDEDGEPYPPRNRIKAIKPLRAATRPAGK